MTNDTVQVLDYLRTDFILHSEVRKSRSLLLVAFLAHSQFHLQVQYLGVGNMQQINVERSILSNHHS